MSDSMRQAVKLRDFVYRGGDANKWWTSKNFSLRSGWEVEKAYRMLHQKPGHNRWKRYAANPDTMNWDEFSDCCGTYVIFGINPWRGAIEPPRILYIGQSKTIKRRLRMHLRRGANAKVKRAWNTPWGRWWWITIAIKLESHRYDRLRLEMALIDRLQPKGNIVGTKGPEGSDG